jgi:hypothetical protein
LPKSAIADLGWLANRTESENFPWKMLENQIFVEIHWPAEGCDESPKNGG